MIIKLRKFRGMPGGRLSSAVYEWQSEDIRDPNKWYPIHRSKIMTNNVSGGAAHYQLINQLFNALLAGLVCVVNGIYFRDTKVMELEL